MLLITYTIYFDSLYITSNFFIMNAYDYNNNNNYNNIIMHK